MTWGVVLTSAGWRKVAVTVHVQRSGLPQFIIQGYPGRVTSFRQSVLVALQQAGIKLPHGKIIIDLQVPAEKMWGELGLLAPILVELAMRFTETAFVMSDVMVGEADLSGKLRCPPVLESILREEELGIRVTGQCSDLAKKMLRGAALEVSSVVDLVRGSWSEVLPPLPDLKNLTVPTSEHLFPLDEFHSLALALVWAGGHSFLMFGSPGEGKTASRRWFECLAPSLTAEEQYVAAVVRCQSLAEVQTRAVEGVAASAGLSQWSKSPDGHLRQACHGAIWLDELPEASRVVRVRLRSWLDRSDADLSALILRGWQASFVATMNPCACGYWGDPRCVCQTSSVAQVLKRVSWPLVDRFALQWRVESPGTDRLLDLSKQLQTLRHHIDLARQTQRKRSSERWNAHSEVWDLSPTVQAELRAWGHHCQSWTPRRQVILAQVAQTLLDGAWTQQVPEAFQLAWQLCRGAEVLRTPLTNSRVS